jgi:hypothetical protein
MKWAQWRVLNYSSWAYNHCDTPETPHEYVGSDYLEGGYGTDCDVDMRGFLDMLRLLTKPDEDTTDGVITTIRAHTFEEIYLDVHTARKGSALSDHRFTLHPLKGLVEYESTIDDIPPHIRNMTIGDWADTLYAAIEADSYSDVETWT